MEYINIIKFFAWFISTCILYKFIKNMIKGNISVINIVFLVFYIFNSLSLILDVFIGIPKLDMFPRFELIYNDNMTNVIYSIFVVYVSVLFYYYSKRLNNIINFKDINNIKIKKSFIFILIIMIVAPSICIFSSPYLETYKQYAYVVKYDIFDEKLWKSYSNFGNLALLSILSTWLIIFYCKPKNSRKYLLISLPFNLIAFWIHGKRNIFIFYIVIGFFVFWNKKIIKGYKILVYGILAIIIMMSFSSIYQKEVRGKVEVNGYGFEQKYSSLRGDFSRDHAVKSAIYGEINKDYTQILDYKCQTIVYNALFFIPRNLWGNKPWPYPVYFTNWALGNSGGYNIGWALTTSIFDELVSNIGLLGLILAPFLSIGLCKFADKKSGIIKLLSMFLAIIIIVLSPATFLIIFVLLFILVVLESITKGIIRCIRKY